MKETSAADIVEKLYQYPSLRKQIPMLINSRMRQFYLLRDKANEVWSEWKMMEEKYNELMKVNKS